MIDLNVRLESREQLLIAGKFLTDLAAAMDEKPKARKVTEKPVAEAVPPTEEKKTWAEEKIEKIQEAVKETLPVTEEVEAIKEALEKPDLDKKLQECRDLFSKKKSPENSKKAKAKLVELGAENISTLPSYKAAETFFTFLSAL